MMPPDTELNAAFAKLKAEQYAALGRFVESFEQMVDAVRVVCMDIISALSNDRMEVHRVLLHIVFHHQALSAKPLFDIMRSMIAEVLRSQEFIDWQRISDAEKATFLGALGLIEREYDDLVSTRNVLLHGTWYIGWPDEEDLKASTFFLYKGISNKDGWARKDDVPRTTEDLNALSIRCDNVGFWIELLSRCLPFGGNVLKIEDCFRRDGKQWRCIRPGPSRG